MKKFRLSYRNILSLVVMGAVLALFCVGQDDRKFVNISRAYSFWGFKTFTPQGKVLTGSLSEEYKNRHCNLIDADPEQCGYLKVLLNHLEVDYTSIR